jgi:hypothetical protein
MKAKSFKYWITQELHNFFGIDRDFNLSLLSEWLSSDEPISDVEKQRLEEMRLNAVAKIDYWNEEELKMKFLSPLIELVNFEGKKYRTFFDRPISVEVKEIRLFGKIDMFVANGFQNPENPYFCIHEYKQENNRDGDPKGQLLAEMLAVQALNQDERPIYGCYVLARNWYFVVLKDKKYGVSDAYVSTQDDIYQIFKFLRFVRNYIDKMNI